eukprot:s2406_g4.t1
MVSSTVQKPLPGPEREVLPIDEHRDEIVRTIRERRVTCIQGETGCGKSSRVPQYVYHLCRPPPKRSGDPERLIVCTQPRRLAAISLAQPRVQVTAGYLLQVLVHDPGQIHRYSHVILDEAAMGCGRDKSGTGLARVAQTARDLTGAQTLHEAA